MDPCGTPEITFWNLVVPDLCERTAFYLKDKNIYIHNQILI